MFPATKNFGKNDEREIDAQTTTSWLAAGIYVPPEDFPELVEKATKNNSSSSNGSVKRIADEKKGDEIGDIQPNSNALVVTSTPKRGTKNKTPRRSPTSTVEEQLQTLHDSFANTLFGCQEHIANATAESAKKNTRSYRKSTKNGSVVVSSEDKLTPNLSLFHNFGAACACIAETNAPGLVEFISSGQSVVRGGAGAGGEEKKDDESVSSRRKKKTKKRNSAATRTAKPATTKPPQIIVDTPPKPTEQLIPMEELIVAENSSPAKVSRQVSELTMRSSYARVHAPVPAQRRMAYYAVGKHNQNKKGGNRRCYYTGKLIVGDNPFYAGCVKQGLRTLVVFCLPSALGLPNNKQSAEQRQQQQLKPQRKPSFVKHMLKRTSSRFSNTSSTTTETTTTTKGAIDSDMFVDGDEDDFDPNRLLNKDYLLSVLPEPSSELLVSMKQKYPDQYRTLPDQVRTPGAWRIYVQFCFFSGLPIAEGECYYMIKSEISEQDYGESIVLCHAIMEAVNGTSSDMVRLPNLKTFEYLKKHYPQQSDKLPKSAFERSSWEVILPEI